MRGAPLIVSVNGGLKHEMPSESYSNKMAIPDTGYEYGRSMLGLCFS